MLLATREVTSVERRERTRELIRIAQTGGPGAIEARNEAVELNVPISIKIAKQLKFAYRLPESLMDDLIQTGIIGLCRAIEDFELDRGVEFSTYATPWIKQSIRRWIDNTNSTIRIPVYVRRAMGGDRNALLKPRAREFIVHAEVALKIGGIERDVAGRSEISPIESDENRGFLDQALDILDDRSREIIARRLGLGRPSETLAEIAESFDLTRARIHQIQNAAIARLRDHFDRLGLVASDLI